MKKLMVTAAALTLGTSAFAWAPAEQAHLGGAKLLPAAQTAWSGDKSPLSFSSFDDKGATTTKAASVGLAEGMKTLADATDGDAKLQMASGDTFVKSDSKVEEASLKTPAADMAAVDMTGKEKTDLEVQTASWDGKAKLDPEIQAASRDGKPEVGAEVQTASWDGKAEPILSGGKDSGMGGPLDEAQGYPPCDPGPGDDNCIQLYERGVPAALAAWKASDGDVAMGGPFEPADAGTGADATGKGKSDSSATADADAPMSHGAGHADHGAPAAGAQIDDGVASAKPSATDTEVGTTPGAIGGPVEARTGYPPCSPGQGDDRCIQLYERGVTGRGN